jgi:glycosyltransferase involved in cell wall biosynthesis
VNAAVQPETPTLPKTSRGVARTGAAGKRILFISGVRVFPCNTGGHVRTGGIARSLARMGHEVKIYSLAGRHDDYGLRGMLRPSHRIDAIEPGLTEETHLGLGYGLIQAVNRRLDYPRFWQYALLERRLIPAGLRVALQEADLILCDLPWCPPIPGPWSVKPWFLVSHNLEHRLLEQGPARHRRFAAWMKGVEGEAPRRYRDIFTCAEEDEDFFRRHDPHGSLGLPLIRCGVDPRAYAVPSGTRERVRAELGIGDQDRLLVFSASGFAPNVEALAELRAFCARETEFLERERVRILVVGTVTPTGFREGALIATGRVPEVPPYLAASDAGLNPITRGSGSNVKLFEYLAAHLPVISTPFGTRGTTLQPEVDFLPFELPFLRSALERFVRERTPEQWGAYAAAVWSRHRNNIDIDELVRQAIERLPDFAP